MHYTSSSECVIEPRNEVEYQRAVSSGFAIKESYTFIMPGWAVSTSSSASSSKSAASNSSSSVLISGCLSLCCRKGMVGGADCADCAWACNSLSIKFAFWPVRIKPAFLHNDLELVAPRNLISSLHSSLLAAPAQSTLGRQGKADRRPSSILSRVHHPLLNPSYLPLLYPAQTCCLGWVLKEEEANWQKRREGAQVCKKGEIQRLKPRNGW